jgi:hypothetical protein
VHERAAEQNICPLDLNGVAEDRRRRGVHAERARDDIRDALDGRSVPAGAVPRDARLDERGRALGRAGAAQLKRMRLVVKVVYRVLEHAQHWRLCKTREDGSMRRRRYSGRRRATGALQHTPARARFWGPVDGADRDESLANRMSHCKCAVTTLGTDAMPERTEMHSQRMTVAVEAAANANATPALPSLAVSSGTENALSPGPSEHSLTWITDRTVTIAALPSGAADTSAVQAPHTRVQMCLVRRNYTGCCKRARNV